MMATQPLRYKAGVTFLVLENAVGDGISLPVYMLLLSEDLLKSLKTLETRYGEELKIESTHGLRKFKVWFFNVDMACRIRIEEFLENKWELVHTYRCL